VVIDLSVEMTLEVRPQLVTLIVAYEARRPCKGAGIEEIVGFRREEGILS
jgi:hypothetical protein